MLDRKSYLSPDSMLPLPENEFERRLLWRPPVQPRGVGSRAIKPINPTIISPSLVEPSIVDPAIIDTPLVKLPILSPPPEPQKANPAIHTTSPVQSFLEARLERAVPIAKDSDDAPSGRAWKAPDLRRLYAAGKLLFQVVGVAGFAGYFVSMHTLMRVFSGMLLAGTWYAIYKIKGSP